MGKRVITSYLDEKVGTADRIIQRIIELNDGTRGGDVRLELKYLEMILKAMLQEVDLQVRYLDGEPLPTTTIVEGP